MNAPRHHDEPAPLDESNDLSLGPVDARDRALALPLTTRFAPRDRITPIQWAFLQERGCIVFAGVATTDEVARTIAEMKAVEAKILAEGIKETYAWYLNNSARFA